MKAYTSRQWAGTVEGILIVAETGKGGEKGGRNAVGRVICDPV